MMASPPPPSDARAAYARFLERRWPARMRLLSAMASVSSLVLLLLDVLMMRLGLAHGAPDLSDVLAARVVCLLMPAGALVAHLLAPSWRHWPRACVALCVLWVPCIHIAFFVAGTQHSTPHVVFFVWSVMAVPTVLPLQARARVGFYVYAVLCHVLLDGLLDPGTRAAAAKALSDATLVLGASTVAWTCEVILRALRRQFFLKLEMGETVRALEASRARVGEAASTLGGLMSGLRQATGQLSAHAVEARGDSERIARVSESVAQGAREASSRASEVAGVVAEAHAHTRQVDVVVGRVERGVDAIGHSINRTQGSLRELEAHARQIDAFTEMLQGLTRQTDVLAINAAIEATRAGEAGRSFSVVARQMRALAESSQGSLHKVQALARGMREQLDSTVQGMDAVQDSSRQLESTFSEARGALDTIRALVARIERSVQSSAEGAASQARDTQSISSGASRLESLVRAQEQMSREVASTADQLGRLADTLRTLLPLAPASGAAPGTDAPPSAGPRRGAA